MTREEAISFLQDIQFNLDYLQLHYNDYNKYKNEERNRVSIFRHENYFFTLYHHTESTNSLRTIPAFTGHLNLRFGIRIPCK